MYNCVASTTFKLEGLHHDTLLLYIWNVGTMFEMTQSFAKELFVKTAAKHAKCNKVDDNAWPLKNMLP